MTRRLRPPTHASAQPERVQRPSCRPDVRSDLDFEWQRFGLGVQARGSAPTTGVGFVVRPIRVPSSAAPTWLRKKPFDENVEGLLCLNTQPFLDGSVRFKLRRVLPGLLSAVLQPLSLTGRCGVQTIRFRNGFRSATQFLGRDEKRRGRRPNLTPPTGSRPPPA